MKIESCFVSKFVPSCRNLAWFFSLKKHKIIIKKGQIPLQKRSMIIVVLAVTDVGKKLNPSFIEVIYSNKQTEWGKYSQHSGEQKVKFSIVLTSALAEFSTNYHIDSIL